MESYEPVKIGKPTVLIPSYNRPQMLKECMESLYQTNAECFDVLIVDDCSPLYSEITSMLEPFASKHHNMYVVQTKANGGFTKCVNYGIKIARQQVNVPSHILLLNNDTILSKSWLDMLPAFHDPKPVGVVAPYRAVWCPDSIYPTAIGQDQPYGKEGDPRHVRDRMIKETGCTEWYEEHVGFWGCMIRFDLFEKYGLFDERFKIICQDLDWSLRIGKYGWKTKVINKDLIGHTGKTHIDLKPRDFIDKNVEEDNRLIRQIWPEKWN